MYNIRQMTQQGICLLSLLLAVVLSGCSSGTKGTQGSATPTTPTTPQSASTYYVNCSLSSDGSGSESSPWNSLQDVNAHTFMPGDSLLLARGTTCSGALLPEGSGSSTSPITVDAYGTGALPIINAGSTNTAAVSLNNQQYWSIADLEIIGGAAYGVYITGDLPDQPLSGITLTNLNVHNATGVSTRRGDSGEVVLAANGVGQTLNNILINGVTAHDSEVSEGIMVGAGGGFTGPPSQTLGSKITIENSTAYNVYGDGITVAEATNAMLENNVVYESGKCPDCGDSTPGGLWEWYCQTCTVQDNESYANQTWGDGDGGDFDIDYYNENNIVQYNYGHDSAGYCVSNFGAENTADQDNIIRYNICSNNEQEASKKNQGDVFFATWDGGSLDGIQVYNNTFYWNPATPGPLLNTTAATFSGNAPDFFKNNIIYSTVPQMISSMSPVSLDYNIYYVTSGAGEWTWSGASYSSLSDYQSGSQQDAHSLDGDPMLMNPTSDSTGMPTSAFTLESGSPAIGAGTNVCAGIANCTIGSQDFFGNPLPVNGTGINIGAYQ
ncbi:MAG: choice-of-anchor Q domain-containing protein [Acidobacteriaceae bacterium]